MCTRSVAGIYMRFVFCVCVYVYKCKHIWMCVDCIGLLHAQWPRVHELSCMYTHRQTCMHVCLLHISMHHLFVSLAHRSTMRVLNDTDAYKRMVCPKTYWLLDVRYESLLHT
jgi:hypothetical protein